MSDLSEKNILIMDVPKPLSCLCPASDIKRERERERGYKYNIQVIL